MFAEDYIYCFFDYFLISSYSLPLKRKFAIFPIQSTWIQMKSTNVFLKKWMVCFMKTDGLFRANRPSILEKFVQFCCTD